MKWVNQSAARFNEALATGASTDPRVRELLAVVRAFPTAAVAVPGPRPEFVAALREQLRVEAAALPARLVPTRRAVQARSATPLGTKVVNIGTGALRTGLLGAAAAGLVVAGVGTASRSATPGATLYPVKQWLDEAAIAMSTAGYDRGMTYLSQAQEHISDTRTLLLAPKQDSTDINVALTEATQALTLAQKQFTAGYAATKSEQNLLAMPDFSARALPQVDAFKPQVPAESQAQYQELRDLLARFQKPAPQSLPALPGSVDTESPTGTSTDSPAVTPSSSGDSGSGSGSTPTGSSTGGSGTGSGGTGVQVPSLPVNPPVTPSVAPPHATLPGVTLPPVDATIAPPPVGPITPPSVVLSGTPTIPSVDLFKVGDTVNILSKNVSGTVTRVGDSATEVRFTALGLTATVWFPNSDLRPA